MKLKTAAIITIVALALILISFGGQPGFSMVGAQSEPTDQNEQGRVAADANQQESENKVVDYEADKIYKARGDSAIRLVGNVIFHHNGAIIQCDSAYRYDEKRMDCFGKVIINQDSTYIYGDIATYDGNTNLTNVYAPLIKLVHGDAVLYTYNLRYNTKTSIGDYTNGGVMTQHDNLMESDEGIYYGNKSTVKFLNRVAMRNDNYQIRSDSASFNMNTEVFTFLAKAYIWDKDRDFLMADLGQYDSKAQVYFFTKNAYSMTPDQEMWADSMQYHSKTREAFMQRNIQILDTAQQVLAFGDWGYYNDSLNNAILTRLPSLMAYEQKGDTAYMRADSIFFYTLKPGMSHYEPAEEESTDSTAMDSTTNKVTTDTITDSLSARNTAAPIDSSLVVADSLTQKAMLDSTVMRQVGDSLSSTETYPPPVASADSLTPALDSTDREQIEVQQAEKTTSDQAKTSNRRKSKREQRLSKADATAIATVGAVIEKEALPAAAVATNVSKSDSIVVASADKIDKIPMPESKKVRKPRNKKRKEAAAQLAMQQDCLRVIDSLQVADSSKADSLLRMSKDSLQVDSLTLDSIAMDSVKRDSMAVKDPNRDSMERVVRAYHNVKVYRKDFQAVADSVVGFSVDSIMNMYGRPILWAEQSQVTSDQIDVYTQNEEIDWADFIGSPFITQEVDTSMYNQASGKSLQAYFRNNEIETAELEGNVMNYYYMEDEDSIVMAFATVMSAKLVMTFKGQEPVRMNWSGQPEWIIYPIEDIPATQPQRLEGFTWSPHLRPKNKEEITTRVVLPSQRQVCTAYKRPEFPVENRLKRFKADLLHRGVWQDRNDLPLVTADYFTNRVLEN